MSVNLATAYVELIPTARGINGAVEKQFAPAQGIAEKAGRDSGDKFTNEAEGRITAGSSRIGSALKSTLAIGSAVIGAAGAVGLKTAAQLEQSEISFTTMLGSGEKAKAFLADLSTFAAKTPFDLPGLNKSASSLISAGIEAHKVIPIMTSLGNATSGMGTGAEGIQRATVAIQQMNAAGKIGAEDLNQLRDAGVPVFDLLTAATGKTTEEIAEMAAKGKLGREELDQLMTALESGKGLEKFNGLMDAQSQSLTGLLATFQDTFSVGIAEAIEPLIPLIKTGLAGATALLADVILPRLQTGLANTVAVATEIYSILAKGDYTGGASGLFGIEEDSKFVDFLFRVHEGMSLLHAGLSMNAITRAQFGGDLEGLVLVGARVRNVFDDIPGSIRAFGAAWTANDGEVTSSGFPGFMERAGYFTRQMVDAARGLDTSSLPAFFDSVGAAGGSVAPVLADIGGSFAQLWPAIREFAGQVPDFATGGLTLLATGLGFLADNVDWILGHMPLLVSLFVAWKVATIAIAAAQAVAVPVQIALNISRIAAARSERGLAADLASSVAALSAHTGATATSAAASGTAAAAATAQGNAVQQGGIKAKLAAAGQWLLNAAMTANPIAIVVVAIAALVAGLVWFFTQTEIGTAIIQTAWAGIQIAIGAVVGWIQDYVVPIFTGALNILGGAVSWLWDTIISPYFGFIFTVLNAFGMLIGKIIEIAVAVIKMVLGAAFTWLWESVISPVFGWIGNVIKGAGFYWEAILGAAGSFIRNVLAPVFTWLWQTIIKPAFDGIGSVVSWVWEHTLKPVFDFLAETIGKAVPAAFDTGVSAVKSAWEKLKDIAKAPVRFVVEKVLNDGLIANVNKIARKVGVGELPNVALPEGFMKGGYTGPGPKTKVAGPVHAGEYVFTKEETDAIGVGNLAAMAASAGKGAAAGAAATAGQGNVGGFFTGNAAAIAKHGAYYLDVAAGMGPWDFPGAARMWDGAAGVKVKTGLGQRQGRVKPLNRGGGILGYTTGTDIDMSPEWMGQLGAVQRRTVAAHEIGHALGLPHNSQGSIMQANLANMAATPTPLDIKNLQSLFPGGSGKAGSGNGDGKGLLAEILEPFKKIANGIIDTIKQNFPGTGTFIDLAVGVGKNVMESAVKFLTNGIEKLKDIASDIWDGAKNLVGLGATATPTLYDNGGLLQPGISLVENGGRRPEPIMTGAQWDALVDGDGGSASGPRIHAPINITTDDPAEAGEYIGRKLERIGR